MTDRQQRLCPGPSTSAEQQRAGSTPLGGPGPGLAGTDVTTPSRPSRGAVLLTGVTGFLGGELLARLLEDGDRRVVALVRARDDEEARSRLRAVLRSVSDEPERFEERVSAVRGDLTEPGLGLPQGGDELAEQVHEILHGAASVSFALPLAESREINVEGTRRVLELAERATRRGGLERLVYVSTAYSAGEHRGLVREEREERPTAFRKPTSSPSTRPSGRSSAIASACR